MTLSARPARSLLAVALALAAAPAFAQTFSQTIFFGDSLTDTGYFRPLLELASPGSTAIIGQFTTNPGNVWAEYLEEYYGTSAAPNDLYRRTVLPPPPGLEIEELDGTNYSAGGALVGEDVINVLLGPVPSLQTQSAIYLSSNGGRADSNALYTVWGGANDLFVAAGDPAQAPLIIGNAVTAQIGIVGALQAAGARYVLVPSIPDIGLTPSSRAQGEVAMAQGTALATAYNDALYGGLAASGIHVIPVDTFHFLQEVAADPSTYGLTNVTDIACTNKQALTCTPADYATPHADETYLFADGVHPTSGAHRMMSQLAISAIEGPRQIALLPHSAAVVGRARNDRVGAHLSDVPDSDGARWWVDVRGDSQRYDDADLYEGVAPAITGGVDWTSGNAVFGAFGGYGRNLIQFGERGGDAEQRDATVGGFIGWHSEGLWVNGQASYTQLRYDVDREVWIGTAKRSHTGSPDGSNMSVSANAGYNFQRDSFNHGPVFSVHSQKIEIDGYAESDPALSTSLAHAEQSFDSLIGSVGWQFQFGSGGHLAPYVRATYDREFEDAPAQVFASSQSLPGTLPYAVPGHHFDDSYGTLTLGAKMATFGLNANVGTSVTVGQQGGNNATVFASFGF